MATTTRESVPITDEDTALIEAARTPGTIEYEAFRQLVAEDDPAKLSKSRALAVLLRLGTQTLAERAQEAGYAAYAASLTDEDREIQYEMSARGVQLTGAID